MFEQEDGPYPGPDQERMPSLDEQLFSLNEAPESGVEDEQAEREAEEQIWSRFNHGPLPPLPKMSAVSRASEAAQKLYDLPEGFAWALAHAAADPAALRAALNSPVRVAVTGGVIESIDVDLFTPGVAPLPTNNRAMEARIYPSAGSTDDRGPLAGPRSLPGTTSTLWLESRSVDHVLDAASTTKAYVLAKNNLRESIAARGVIMPVTVSYYELRHADDEPSMPILSTDDGSSRITNALEVLGLTEPRTTLYDFPSDRNGYRRFIDSIVTADPDELTSTERRRVMRQRNALVVPARVFLRFTPSSDAYDYARAVGAYVGMLHVDPPKPWSQTGKYEAMADSVLEVMRIRGLLPEERLRYVAGMLTPDEAGRYGLPRQRDEQAAYILREMLDPYAREVVERGVRDVTAKKSVSPSRRVDVSAELALRSTRSAALAAPAGDPLKAVWARIRAPYMRASHLSAYSNQRWSVTGRDPDEILAAALNDLAAQPRRWASRLELAALGQYHLAAMGGLAREAMNDPRADKRGPQQILAEMIADERGLRILHRAVVDGRAGRRPRLVDEHGGVIRGRIDPDDGSVVPDDAADEAFTTDYYLRYQAYPDAGGARPAVLRGDTPLIKAEKLKRHARELGEDLARAIDELGAVASDGSSIMDSHGWSAAETGELSRALQEVQGQLSYWGVVASRVNAPVPDDDLGDTAEEAAYEDEEPPGVGEEDDEEQ